MIEDGPHAEWCPHYNDAVRMLEEMFGFTEKK